MTWVTYEWALRHGYEKNKYENPAYDKQDEIQNTHDRGKVQRMSKTMIMPIIVALSCFIVAGCRNHQVEHSFFDRPPEDRLERLRGYSLAEQYKIFRYGHDVKEPPVMELAGPIAERGASAVPFLVDQLNA
jgi:hypothetical protein